LSLLEDGPELAAEVDALHDDQKRLAQLAYHRAVRQELYEILMRDQDSMLADDLYGPMGVVPKRAITSPAVAITRGTTEGLACIRHSFLTSRRLWGSRKVLTQTAHHSRLFRWRSPIRMNKKLRKNLHGLGLMHR